MKKANKKYIVCGDNGHCVKVLADDVKMDSSGLNFYLGEELVGSFTCWMSFVEVSSIEPVKAKYPIFILYFAFAISLIVPCALLFSLKALGVF